MCAQSRNTGRIGIFSCGFDVTRFYDTPDGLYLKTSSNNDIFSDADILTGKVERINIVEGEFAHVILIGKKFANDASRIDVVNLVTDMFRRLQNNFSTPIDIEGEIFYDNLVHLQGFIPFKWSEMEIHRDYSDAGMTPELGSSHLGGDEYIGFFVFNVLLGSMSEKEIWFNVNKGLEYELGAVTEQNQDSPILRYNKDQCLRALRCIGALRVSKLAADNPIPNPNFRNLIKRDFEVVRFYREGLEEILNKTAIDRGAPDSNFVANSLKQQPFYSRLDQFRKAANSAYEIFQEIFPKLREEKFVIPGNRCPF